MTPMKAIRAKCIDCSCGNRAEVALCRVAACPLYTLRLGRNVNRPKRVLTEEQRKAIVERFAKARKARNEAL